MAFEGYNENIWLCWTEVRKPSLTSMHLDFTYNLLISYNVEKSIVNLKTLQPSQQRDHEKSRSERLSWCLAANLLAHCTPFPVDSEYRPPGNRVMSVDKNNLTGGKIPVNKLTLPSHQKVERILTIQPKRKHNCHITEYLRHFIG